MPEVELKAAETYRRLLRYVKPYRWIVVAAVFPAAIYAIAGTILPLLLGRFVEQLQDAARNAGSAWQYPVLIALGFPIRGAMDVLTVYGLAWVGRSVIRDLRSEVFAHLPRLAGALLRSRLVRRVDLAAHVCLPRWSPRPFRMPS
jgi:subfamily B ATP-binding cassette protein MsbA